LKCFSSFVIEKYHVTVSLLNISTSSMINFKGYFSYLQMSVHRITTFVLTSPNPHSPFHYDPIIGGKLPSKRHQKNPELPNMPLIALERKKRRRICAMSGIFSSGFFSTGFLYPLKRLLPPMIVVNSDSLR